MVDLVPLSDTGTFPTYWRTVGPRPVPEVAGVVGLLRSRPGPRPETTVGDASFGDEVPRDPSRVGQGLWVFEWDPGLVLYPVRGAERRPTQGTLTDRDGSSETPVCRDGNWNRVRPKEE